MVDLAPRDKATATGLSTELSTITSTPTHRPAPISDHVGHHRGRRAVRGQALQQEAQQVQPVLDEGVRHVNLLQHVRERVLQAVKPPTNRKKIDQSENACGPASSDDRQLVFLTAELVKKNVLHPHDATFFSTPKKRPKYSKDDDESYISDSSAGTG